MNSLEEPIDSRQLMAFVHLAHGGNLKAAAKVLMVTESAISHAVRNLENSLDTKLFRRFGKGLALTPSGTLLLNEAVQILGKMRDVRSRIHNAEGAENGEIRIASATSFIRSALHDILFEFRYCFPSVEINVAAADRTKCIEDLTKGDADAAIMVNLPKNSENLSGQILFSDELWVLMAANHPLARFPVVPLHALCREKIFMRQKENFTTRMIEQEIARWSFHLRNIVHIGSFEAAGELVRLGMGVTFQSPWAIRHGRRNGDFTWRRVEELDLRRDWYFVWPTANTMNLRMKTLLQLSQIAGTRLSRKIQSCEMGATEPITRATPSLLCLNALIFFLNDFLSLSAAVG